MRFFGLLLVLCTLPAQAETIRVAVARGQEFVIEGNALTLRASNDADSRSIDSPAVFELTGPFISADEELAESWLVEDAGGTLKVNGAMFGGSAELVIHRGVIVAIDHVDLETYVASVVGAELPSDWPAAAMEAQAIAARTYVLQRRELFRGRAPFDVEATVAAQVYNGRDSHSVPSVLAAHETKGEVLRFEGALVEAYFFSKCRGQTETAKNAFGRGQPYLIPVSCESGEETPALSWQKTFSLESLQERLGLSSAVSRVTISKRSSGGRVASVKVEMQKGTRLFSGADFRRLLGYQALPSLDFQLVQADGEVRVKGSGSGHGVGLAQWGAFAMAKRGKTAHEILEHFYPGTTVEPLYPGVVASTHP